VATPANPYDALGLLRTAVADDNPVIYAEHSKLYQVRGEVPDEPYHIPFGKAEVKRPGKDVTIVAYSRMVHTALEAADTLAARGVEAEVVDLRTLRPLDTETVIQSVKKTNRAVVVEETWRTGGFAGELASTIQEEAFDDLDGPVGRVGGLDVPAPYASNLEEMVFPDAARIVEEIERLFGV
jgi:pyruvate/2-oxoglutarate/acetoin dehydrogenase E1 component